MIHTQKFTRKYFWEIGESSILHISRSVIYLFLSFVIMLSMTMLTNIEAYSSVTKTQKQLKRYQSNIDKLGSSRVGQKIRVKTSNGLSGHVVVDDELKSKFERIKSKARLQGSSLSNTELLKKLHKEFEENFYVKLVNTEGLSEARGFVSSGDSIELVGERQDLAYAQSR